MVCIRLWSFVAGLVLLTYTSNAYTINPTPNSAPKTRAAFLQTQSILAINTLWLVSPAWVFDDPEKNIRTVKASQRRLSSSAVAGMVNDGDYLALQQILRQPPVSDIRKACSQLAKDDAELQARYRTFIAALEQMDTTAMVAQRGRKIGEMELLERYNAVVVALGEFAKTAIPEEASVDV